MMSIDNMQCQMNSHIRFVGGKLPNRDTVKHTRLVLLLLHMVYKVWKKCSRQRHRHHRRCDYVVVYIKIIVCNVLLFVVSMCVPSSFEKKNGGIEEERKRERKAGRCTFRFLYKLQYYLYIVVIESMTEILLLCESLWIIPFFSFEPFFLQIICALRARTRT